MGRWGLDQFFGVVAAASNVGHGGGTYTLEMFQADFPQFFHTVKGENGSTATAPFLPLSVLEGVIRMAGSAIRSLGQKP